MASKIVITDAGRAEILNAEQTGTAAVKLTHVGFGTGKYTATTGMTALQAEFKRIDAVSGVVSDDRVISLKAVDKSKEAYTVNEFGVFTENGTLFAVYSQSEPFIQKAAESIAHLAIDIKVEDINVESIAFGDTNFVIPAATTETQGIVELATVDEALTGEDDYRAVTPQGMNARVGVVESFVQNDVMASINDLNDRVSNNTLTPFCINQGPLSTSGEPNVLAFANDVSKTAEVAFETPVISQNGAYGGETFAVGANQNTSTAFVPFSNLSAEWNSETQPSESAPADLIIYTPTALALSSLTLQNSADDSRIWSTMRIFGSNSGSAWNELSNQANGNRLSNAWVNVPVESTIKYKYFKLSFTANYGGTVIAVKRVRLNATMTATITGGRVSFKGPLVATTAQGEKFTADSIADIDLSAVKANVVYVYLDRSGAPQFTAGNFHASQVEPTSYSIGDVWFKTAEPLASYQWLGEWVEKNIAPVGEVYLDGTGKITAVSTYPYNQNGYTVNSNTVATPSTFGLVRTAAVEDEMDCSCSDASVTPSNFMKVGDYRIASKAYAVGERVRCLYHADFYLVCTKAGTTSDDALDTRDVTNGQSVSDGSVVWQVREDARIVDFGEARHRDSTRPTYGLS